VNIAKSKWNAPGCRAERRSARSGYGAAVRAAFAVALVEVLLCGCGKIPSTRYYTFKLPALAPATDSKTNLVLEIEPFRASDNLRDTPSPYVGPVVRSNSQPNKKETNNNHASIRCFFVPCPRMGARCA